MEKSIEQLEKENSELCEKLKTFADFIKHNPALNVSVPLNLEQLQILIRLVEERQGNI